MQGSVTVVVEIAPAAGIAQMEQAILEAGRQAMGEALKQAVRGYEEAPAACPGCGSGPGQSPGTVARRVVTEFGRVVVRLRRQRCRACSRRFRPASGCRAELAGGNVTPRLGAACALAGASWPYATAARVLRELCGAPVSHEEVRRWTGRLGAQTAEAHRVEAERLLAPTAEQVRQERDAQRRRARLGAGGADVPPARLLVGLDGGWLPSREQLGGMEGKVGVVATGVAAVGAHGRQRLTPRRYVATFGDSEQVGALTSTAAVALGGHAAREQLVLGDGAAGITTQTATHFPDARAILDGAPVARALHRAIRAARPGRPHRDRRRELPQAIPDLLWHGELDATLDALPALRPAPSTPPADPIPGLADAIT